MPICSCLACSAVKGLFCFARRVVTLILIAFVLRLCALFTVSWCSFIIVSTLVFAFKRLILILLTAGPVENWPEEYWPEVHEIEGTDEDWTEEYAQQESDQYWEHLIPDEFFETVLIWACLYLPTILAVYLQLEDILTFGSSYQTTNQDEL